MTKLMIFLARPATIAVPAFQAAIENGIAAIAASFSHICYALVDDMVAPAQPLAITSSSHPKDAVVSLYAEGEVNLSTIADTFVPIASVVQAYWVDERRPLSCQSPVGRTNGMCQIALFKKPANLTRNQWLEIWLGSHTQIAIDTQSTFSYRQNIVESAAWSEEYPVYDAIVEEQFPFAAMTDRSVFFDAPGDEARYKANEKAMVDSVTRFIDFTAFECVPMSEYRIK